jgi:hypothetical protein
VELSTLNTTHYLNTNEKINRTRLFQLEDCPRLTIRITILDKSIGRQGNTRRDSECQVPNPSNAAQERKKEFRKRSQSVFERKSAHICEIRYVKSSYGGICFPYIRVLWYVCLYVFMHMYIHTLYSASMHACTHYMVHMCMHVYVILSICACMYM